MNRSYSAIFAARASRWCAAGDAITASRRAGLARRTRIAPEVRGAPPPAPADDFDKL
jgi:hypothetical protein